MFAARSVSRPSGFRSGGTPPRCPGLSGGAVPESDAPCDGLPGQGHSGELVSVLRENTRSVLRMCKKYSPPAETNKQKANKQTKNKQTNKHPKQTNKQTNQPTTKNRQSIPNNSHSKCLLHRWECFLGGRSPCVIRGVIVT